MFSPSAQLSHALRIVRTLQNAGHTAMFAGGCVRDALLERDIHDIDIATSAVPDTVEGLFEHTLPVGKAFGVIIVVIEGINYEVATFREDGGYQDGRRPDSVSFCGREEDAKRRDFTINAMFYDPITNALHDDVGGRADLTHRIIRAVGNPDRRFDEDKLRMMRACRFAARYDFALDATTQSAIQQHSEAIIQVSPERIGDELSKMLTDAHPRRAIELLDACDLLAHILPEIEALKGVAQPEVYHPEGDVYIHTLMLLDNLLQPSKALAFGALLHDIGKPATQSQTQGDRLRFNGHDTIGAIMARHICERLRFSNQDTQAIETLVAQHMGFIPVQKMRTAKLKKFLWQDNAEEMLALHRADCLASNGDLSNYTFCQEKLATWAAEPQKPAPLVTGRDLMAWGYKPGKAYKDLLDHLYEGQLEGAFASTAEAKAWLTDNPLPTP